MSAFDVYPPLRFTCKVTCSDCGNTGDTILDAQNARMCLEDNFAPPPAGWIYVPGCGLWCSAACMDRGKERIIKERIAGIAEAVNERFAKRLQIGGRP